jgi:glyoxylase-like metal-dependent hydrolase (beta-lactamase superfamily II)
MSVQLYAMTCGWITMPLGLALEGEEGTIRVPVPCFLIDHPEGKVLFDSGLHTRTQTEADAYLGPMASLFQIDFKPGEEVAGRLEQLEIEVGEIRYLISSHLHFDHAGGNAQIPDACVVIQRREWEAGHDPEMIRAGGYNPADYDLGHEVMQIDGEYDLLGDGSVVCIPTYGHTAGHQSVQVQLARGKVLLAGDACYLRRTLEQLHLAAVLYDREQEIQTLEKLRALESKGVRVYVGHDPEFWETVPQAPLSIDG